MGDVLQPPLVRRRVDVELGRPAVEHALRCYLTSFLADGTTVPSPVNVNAIEVAFSLTGEQHTASGCPELESATLTYSPAAVHPAPASGGERVARLRAAAEALIQRYVENRGTSRELISGLVHSRALAAGREAGQVWAEWDELRRALGEEIPL